MGNSNFLSNTSVESIYETKEEVERFFREAKHSKFYRRGVALLISKEIDSLVLKEEAGEDPVSNVAMRKALRQLKRIIEIGGLDA